MMGGGSSTLQPPAPPPPPPSAFRAPKRGACPTPLADTFRLGAVLGRGGFGTVVRGERMSDGAAVAIKYLRDNGRATWRAQVLEEIRMMELVSAGRRAAHGHTAKDSHTPTLLDWFDIPAHDGLQSEIVIVCTLAEGGELFKCLCDGLGGAHAISDVDRFNIARRLLKALAKELAVLHSRHIVHRDIKFENILIREKLERDGLPRRDCTFLLADVGLAWEFGPSGDLPDPHYSHGLKFGTANWRAPEVEACRGRYTPPADIYALGLVVLRVLTPEMSEASTLLANVPKNFRDDDVMDLLAKMVDADPSKRPTALEILDTSKWPWVWDKTRTPTSTSTVQRGSSVAGVKRPREFCLLEKVASTLGVTSRSGSGAGATSAGGAARGLHDAAGGAGGSTDGETLGDSVRAALRSRLGDRFAAFMEDILRRGSRRADLFLPLLSRLQQETPGGGDAAISLVGLQDASIEVFCRVYDRNGDGMLDAPEITQMFELVRYTPTGKAHSFATEVAQLQWMTGAKTDERARHESKCFQNGQGVPCGKCAYYYVDAKNRNAGVVPRETITYASLVDAFKADAIRVCPLA